MYLENDVAQFFFADRSRHVLQEQSAADGRDAHGKAENLNQNEFELILKIQANSAVWSIKQRTALIRTHQATGYQSDKHDFELGFLTRIFARFEILWEQLNFVFPRPA